ncbi:hypothetical protein AXA44_36750 [Rhodococcus sp. SC4]|nr:hypothetical protein AXA44_36750 [Rhodococcus sp. SC4]
MYEDASRKLAALIGALDEWERPDGVSPAGQRGDLPGRGHPLLMPLVIDEIDDQRVQGRVTFRRFHLGVGSAHGGTQPLLFDELLGTVAAWHRGAIRTAYLHVDYRALTPVDVELTVEGSIDRTDGRKLWASGRLFNGSTLLAESSALFVRAYDHGA